MVSVLERLGVLDDVLELGCPPLTREFNYTDGGTEATSPASSGRTAQGPTRPSSHRSTTSSPTSSRAMDMAGTHATFLAGAIGDRLRGSVDERTVFTNYHERRNAHGLSAYQDTVRFASDLRQLES
jgi:hypothetical protein